MALDSYPSDRELVRRHRDGDRRARGALIERHIPLARSLALRYRRSSEPVDDLVQVACLGLVKAVDRWDPDRGLVFATYAVPTILGELRRHFRDKTWVVRPPRDLMDLTLAIERAREPLGVATGREPTANDLAAHLGRSRDTIDAALHAVWCRWPVSLDDDRSPEYGAESATLGIDDRRFEEVEGRAGFEQLIAILGKRAREVLRLRFERELSQSEIAGRVGCSQVGVSRILRASLDKVAAHIPDPATGAAAPAPAAS